MSYTIKKSIVISLLLCASSFTLHAGPVLFCANGPGIDLVTDGCISGESSFYPSGGDGVYSNTGGGDPESAVEAAILAATGVAVDIALLGESETGNGTNSGTWNFAQEVAYITVKAANSFALFEVGGATTGSWSTAGILTNGGSQPGLSHIRFWSAGATSVPEPGTLGIITAGLVCLVLLRRRSFQRS